MGTKTVQQQYRAGADFLLLTDYTQCGGGLFPVSFQVKNNLSSSSSSSTALLMDKLPIEQRRSLEAIKTTMQKQEEVFRQQVRELHRLYSVQRMLMDELKTHDQIERQRTTTTTITTNLLIPSLATPHHQTNLGFTLDIPIVQFHPPTSSNSQTTIPSQPKGLFDLECHPVQEPNHHPREEIHAAGPSSRKMVHGEGEEDDCCGVDLTLSIGGGSSKRRVNESRMTRSLGCPGPGSEPLFTTNAREIAFVGSVSSDNKDCSSTNPTTNPDQDEKPHWPFHGLSLKRM